MKPVGVVERFMNRAAGVPYSPYLLALVPVVIGSVRLLEESYVSGGPTHLYVLAHYVLAYLLLQVLLATVVGATSGLGFVRVLGAVSVGLTLALLPPLLHELFPTSPGMRYQYFEEFRWSFAASYQPLSETVVVWLAVAAAGLFTAAATRSLWRALASFAGAYLVLQFWGWGWVVVIARRIASLYSGDTARDPEVEMGSSANLVGLLIVLAIYAYQHRATLLPSLKRMNHTLPWGAVAAFGARATGECWAEALLKGVFLVLAAQLALFANDYFDREQDASHGGTARPVSRDDVVFFTMMQALFCIAWSPESVPYLIVFFTLWAAYHIPPLRLKRLFCGGYTIEGVAAAMAFGFAVADNTGRLVGSAVPTIMLLVCGGFALGSMFKDYKDIEQDRADKMGTTYTLLVKRGVSPRAVHVGVVVATSLALLTPVVWFASRGAWPAAAILAGLVVVTALALLLPRSPKRAVESGMWGLSLYLAVLVWLTPSGIALAG